MSFVALYKVCTAYKSTLIKDDGVDDKLFGVSAGVVEAGQRVLQRAQARQRRRVPAGLLRLVFCPGINEWQQCYRLAE